MTKREVLKNLERLKISSMACGMQSDNPTYEKAIEALNIAIAALRGPTREQVEKAWRGEWERITDAYWETEGFLCKCGTQTYSASNFCPRCGSPMTDEAVDIMLKRLEVMKDENRTD